jgi:hypothetical protein
MTWPTTQLADEVEFTGAMTKAEHDDDRGPGTARSQGMEWLGAGRHPSRRLISSTR